MTIPVSTVVNTSITIGATFPARAGFGTLNIVTAETGVIGIAERIRAYSDISGVTADWGSSTEVVAAATDYFSQQPKPTSLVVSTRYESAQAAQLRGGAVLDNAENLALFTAITDGDFSVSIDGSAQDITSLNFSADTDLTEVADAIQVALQAIATGGFTSATCTHDGNRFFINSGTTGASSTISFASAISPASGVNISSLLQMEQGEGTKVIGIVGETISQSLSNIDNVNPDWYGFLFTKEVRDGVQVNGEDAVEAAAAWAEARTKILFNTTNDFDAKDAVTTNDIGSVLQASVLGRTISTSSSYPAQYPSASVAGRAFTVDFSQPNSTITLKFKQLPGITVENLTVSEKLVLDSKNINAFSLIGDSSMYSESKMANGTFLDEVHGTDWLKNAVQTNVFGYMLTQETKYTDKGTASLEQQVIRAFDEARRNGLIAPGTTIDGEFLPNGYKTTVIPVADVNQSEKEARQYNGLSGVVLGAGAIHGVQINIVFER
tara:strand:- start:12459 stop:13940 length:1482 start_codon:yes stop_codon:yes gene_type:complete